MARAAGIAIILGALSCSPSGGNNRIARDAPTNIADPGVDDPAMAKAQDVSVDVGERLLERMQRMPFRSDPTFNDIGGFISTEQSIGSESEAISKPQMTINRSLSITRSGAQAVGGNSLSFRASVPAGAGQFRTLEFEFSFTQHSALTKGDLSLARLEEELGSDNGLTLSNVAWSNPEGPSESYSYNFETDEWTGAEDNASPKVSLLRIAAQMESFAERFVLATSDDTLYLQNRFDDEDICLGSCVITGIVDFEHESIGEARVILALSRYELGGRLVVLDENFARHVEVRLGAHVHA